jgi:hypothetical protein
MQDEDTAPTPATDASTEDEAFKRRLARSVALARTLQRLMRELHKGTYYWNKNIAAVLPAMYVMALLVENDRLKRPPLTPTQIEEIEQIPRKSASRYLDRLVKQGLATRKDNGYVTNPAFYRATISASYIRRATAVLKSAGPWLRKLMK